MGFILSQTLCLTVTLFYQKYFVHLSFIISVELSTLFLWLSHKVALMFLNRFEVDTPLCCFIWVIDDSSHNYVVWTDPHFSLTFIPCLKVDTPLQYFLLSHCWPILIITLCRLSHIFSTLFWVNITKILCKCISIVSNWTLSSNTSTLLCGTLTHGFILSNWVIYDPPLFFCCVDCHTYFLHDVKGHATWLL